VDRRAVTWWTVRALLDVVPVAVVLGVLAAVLEEPRPWLVAALVATLVVGIPYVLIMPRWRYRVHRWESTDEAVYARSGWLWQEWRVAPMSRIQTVDTVRGPLQQLFRLSTLTVTTASAKGAIKIDGLDHELAADLVARLTAIAQATPGDAT
jgi:hypothetical protein